MREETVAFKARTKRHKFYGSIDGQKTIGRPVYYARGGTVIVSLYSDKYHRWIKTPEKTKERLRKKAKV